MVWQCSSALNRNCLIIIISHKLICQSFWRMLGEVVSTMSRTDTLKVSDFTSTETKIFRGGLRHYPKYNEKLIYGTRDTPMAYHDRIDYERGCIVHSRSPSNQYINFHYMFGGFRNYFWNRWFMNHWYRRNLRNWWLPVLLWYTCKTRLLT